MQVTRRQMMVSAAAGAVPAAPALPQVPFGKHSVSRLIVGGNPVSGNSHVDARLSSEMADYFTAANVKKMLRECEAAGINTWQSRADRHILRLLREYRNEGGKIQWLAQTASEIVDVRRNIAEIAAAGAIGAYHHGNRTDALYMTGKLKELQDYMKAMHDAGLRAGVGTHIPECHDLLESKDWGIDFYMTCLYNLSRIKEECENLNGGPLKGEFFYDPDRERMLNRARLSTKQCLIFKVYGATRKCGSEVQMKEVMRQVFSSAKPSDCVVIGMFPKASDQVSQNARLLRETLGGR
jgi:hypothetical protein